MKELYFCLKLTETEHDTVSCDLSQECKRYNCYLVYYRKLKDGHVPMYREIKIRGHKNGISRILNFIEKSLKAYMEVNPHKS